MKKIFGFDVIARAKPVAISVFLSTFLPFYLSTCLYSIPQKMNIQGRLVNKQTNQPLTIPTPVRFEIYSGGDEFLGGTLLYRENATVSPDVIGLFSHQIGSGQILLGSLSAEIFKNENIFLQIIIKPDTTEQEVLQPRQKMVSVSYAFVSEHADYAEKSKTAETADIAQTVPAGAITTDKIKDKALTLPKLSDDVLNTFITVSTEPATQGQLVLPSANPVISASTPDGKITLNNDTQIAGLLRVGTHTVTIGTIVEGTAEIEYSAVGTALLTSRG